MLSTDVMLTTYYRFGAVLEEFEVAEAMNNVLAQKPTMMTAVAY